MKMTGEQRIAASRERTWEALNDPDVLRQCIPGCQSLEKEADDRFKATVAIKVGPIGAKFTGAVTLSDIAPPNGYTIKGEGQGGAAGFAKGSAKVALSDEGGATLLTYEVDAQVGGRLAQLGGAIIDATAKQLAGTFFKRFGEIVSASAAPSPSAPPAAEAAPAVQASPAAAPLPAPADSPLQTFAAAPAQTVAPAPAYVQPAQASPIAWILAIVVAALVGFFVGRAQGGTTSEWAGLSIGLLVLIVGAAAFEFGRRAAAPVVLLDSALLDRLARGDRR